MADTKISAFAAVTAPQGTQELPVNDNAVSKKITVSQLMDASRTVDVGTISMGTETEMILYDHLKIAGANRFTINGTAEVLLLNLRPAVPVDYRGMPKSTMSPFTVPDGWQYRVNSEIALVNAMRVTLLGNADFILSDDFATRSRIVLAGRG